MARRPVTHARRHSYGNIRALAFPGAAWSPRYLRDIVRDIESGRHSYYVPWQDRQVDIHVVQSAHGPYLRTDPDASDRNNLDELPEPRTFEPGDRASVTTWTRIEPRCRSEDLRSGLAAPTYDPLWLLTRQWQLGEFALSDGGSPVTVRLQGSYTRLDRYRAGAGQPWSAYDPAAAPLETLVEREPTAPPEPGTRFAAEAGLHFLRLLRALGAGHLASAYTGAYRLASPDGDAPPEEEATPEDEATPESGSAPESPARGYLRVMAGRVPDGGELYADLDPVVRPPGGAAPQLPERPEVPAAHRDTVLQAALTWLAWCDDLSPAGDQAPASWTPARMEHTFAVSAPAPHTDGRLTLTAAGYPGGHLDWDDFDARLDPTGDGDGDGGDSGRDGDGGESGRVATPVDETVLPTPVRFPGMPAARWWEMADGRVDLTRVETPREDLAQLLLLECALVYGNDWFVLPLELPVGAVCHLHRLVVTDTFGYETSVPPVRGQDPQWRMYSLTGLAPADEVLVLPPALGPALGSAPLEEVLLLRDEDANLAWAVERTVQDPTGGTRDRAEAYARTHRRDRGRDDGDGGEPAGDGGGGGEGDGEATLAYRLATGVPDYWIPLVPVRVDEPEAGEHEVRLRRGVVQGHDGTPATEVQGRLLEPGRRLVLFEEEVPRAGVRLTRRHQYARWTGGTVHLWRGRGKRTGRGEGESGLRYDTLSPPADPRR